jgi:3-deoxy-D-manno-octulosonic-acid transferase
VSITGNLKLDVPAPAVNPHTLNAMQASIGNRPIIAAGSTHPGEEGLVIDAHRRLRPSFPGLITLIAPRHPERGPSIAAMAKAAGLIATLRSRGHLPDRRTDVYVADTIGELGLLYRLAPMVFIGGSLVRHGGQNPVEAVKLGAAILHGPHVWNFAEIYEALDAQHGAEQVTDINGLTARFGAWLADAAARTAACEAALKTIEPLGGALTRTLAALEPYLMQMRLEHR